MVVPTTPTVPPPAPAALCARCKTSPGTVTGRNDFLCSACFLSYARSKPIKRMDPFRVRNAPSTSSPPLLLLPFSFGVSSLTLLHVLREQMASQRSRVGRTGYELLVVWVDDSGVTGDTEGSRIRGELLQKLEGEYGGKGEGIRFQAIRLEQVYTYSSNQQDANTGTELEKLRALIAALPSLSSQQDILTILLTHLLTLFALDNNCAAVLYAHSTTRLAEKTLSETAKGRGYSVPLSTGDCAVPLPPSFTTHSSPTTTTTPPPLQSVYPLRDLLKKELTTYISLTPALQPFHVPDHPPSSSSSSNAPPIPTSAKDISIDALMKQYFAGMEQTYPSIVANVVKTIGRVPVPTTTITTTIPTTTTNAEQHSGAPNCGICGFPVDMDEGDIWAEEDREGKAFSGSMLREMGLEVGDLCGGCRRSVEGIKPGAGGGAGMRWPL